ncbi:HIR complex subunit, partial [Coemansia sp. RSA 2607]
MRIVKPDWLHHDADKKKLTAIFSVDFHPDGRRLATAGMDNKIRLWSTRAISGESTDEPRLVSTLTAHSGAVMCVRFSHGSGRYMASGADDMVVLIWEKDSEVATGNLTGNPAGGPGPTETWRPLRRLTGHESDVCDLAWSPDNRFLATCGLDNAIFIWDGRTFERIKKLTDHTQFVKGLTFDPAGRYLASQSDDKTLRIWRTSDWALHKTIGKPFEDNIFSTYFRRPSWAPDGECIATANAANGKAPVAAVVRRDSWEADLSFVGHRGAIEAVRFNPRVFAAPGSQQAGDEENTSGVVTVCAAGGQDRGVSVWLTSQAMPIAAATNLFGGNLMDLAWHTVEPSDSSQDDGAVVALLAACSYDGTVAVLEFTQAELGRPIALDDQEKMLEKYGFGGARRRRKRARVDGADGDDGDGDDDDDDGGGGASGRPKPLAESVEQLRLEQQGVALAKGGVEPSTEAAATDTTSTANTANTTSTNAPAETPIPLPMPMPVPVRTKDGKKRVTPLFVRPLGGARETLQRESMPPPVTTTTGTAAPALVSTPGFPSAVPERQTVDPPLWIEAR